MAALAKINKLAIFGLGEAGSLIASELIAASVPVTAYDPADVATPPGVIRVHSPEAAVQDAEVIVALTSGDDAIDAICQAIDAIPAATLYADFSTNSATEKQKMAALADSHGFDFVGAGRRTIGSN